jgi:hypothetical protein
MEVWPARRGALGKAGGPDRSYLGTLLDNGTVGDNNPFKVGIEGVWSGSVGSRAMIENDDVAHTVIGGIGR